MKFLQLTILLIVLAFLPAQAQQAGAKAATAQTERTYVSHELKEDRSLEVVVNDGVYTFKMLSEQVIETLFIPKGQIVQSIPKSHAVVNNQIINKFRSRDIGSSIYYGSTDLEMTVYVHKSPFAIEYNKGDFTILKEGRGYVKNDSLHTIELKITDDEVLYGGGARALGMNRRGNRLQLYNRAHYGYETRSELMNYTLPIVISSKNYMIHFDNAPIGFLDLDSKKNNTITYETISGAMRYQVITGSNLQEVTENYVTLTGKQPMPPRWALGNFASRFGYHSQQEVETTISKFKENEIPLDAVILDLYWFGKDIKGTMGNLKFHRDSFPDPDRMIQNLKKQNVETILITEPFVLSTSDRWQEAVEADILAKDSLGNPYQYEFYFGNTGLLDIFSDSGKTWFKDIYKGLSDRGVNGFWGDLGEPEVHPSDLIHATGTADEVHNIYGHDWAKLVYEASLEANPYRRPFVLMRAGYSGSQRYGMIPWSGDVNRSWGGLQSQPEIALQMGMQGLGYMHSDLGGFAGDNLDDELYTRWLQYGIFQPIYRPHAQEEVPSEPVYRSEKVMQLAKKAIKLRYKLLPYNYQLAFENHTNGTPLMRPISYLDHQRNEESSSYLWGNSFFITPITQSGLKTIKIELPNELEFSRIRRGEKVYDKNRLRWFDFYTDEVYKSGRTITYDLQEDQIPTFVRAGAFIPMSKDIQSTKEYDGSSIELHYYHHKSVEVSRQSVYNDDGSTHDAYEKGMYEMMNYSAFAKAKSLKIYLEATSGNDYLLANKNVELIIHNIERKPKDIQGFTKKQWNWNKESKTLTIPLDWNMANKKEVAIQL
jgi:alpha-glucosidase (family GH31 glycosyl hydrolase)